MQLDIDIRDTDDDRRDAVISAAFDAAAEIAARRNCGFSTSTIFKYPAGISAVKVRSNPFFARNRCGCISNFSPVALLSSIQQASWHQGAQFLSFATTMCGNMPWHASEYGTVLVV